MAANNMVPPMDPRAMAAMGMPNPFAPPIPPPPSPSLGFQAWASDPQNAHKVVPAMTGPDQPLQPNAGMASANPPQPPPMASAAPPTMPAAQPPAPTQLSADQTELQRLQKNGAGLNQTHNGFLRGLEKAGDIALPFLIGGGAAAVPGTTLHNRYLQNQQQGRIANDQAALQANAQLADTQSQTQQRTSLGAKADAQADAYQPVTLTQDQAEAIGLPNLAGESMPSRTYQAMLTGKQKTDSSERIQTGKNTTAATVQTGKNQTAEQIASERNARISAMTDAANKTKVLLQGMKDQTSRANTGDRIAAKGTPAANGKVPMDVTKRAALASNVNENADAIETLLTKRPDIVGAGGGRYTNVQQMIGSNDSDIQELGVRMHNIALASNGAHGLRSAEAVAQTEHELFNNFKTGPQGIQGGLRGIRQSVQTFLDDEKNFQQSGRRTGNPMQPPTQGTKAADPLRIR